MPRIVALSGDPGGARAVAPVIAALEHEAGIDVLPLAYREARAEWAHQGVRYREIPETLTADEAAALLRQSGAALLLTGTSVNEVSLEKRFVAAARSMHVPSLAILDFWSNYAARFADEHGALTALPDRIAVMDEQARTEMIADGIPAHLIVSTGQPAFDGLESRHQRHTPRQRASARAALGIAPPDLAVLYVSQPLATLYGDSPASPRYLGYTQQTVLDLLVTALDGIASRSQHEIILVVRPHPRERSPLSLLSHSTHLKTVVTDDGDTAEVLLAMDLVTGMWSSLLVEACLLGCLVASIQPGPRHADLLPTNRQGYSQPIYRAEDVEPTVERLLLDEAARQQVQTRLMGLRAQPGATQRVVALVRELLQGR